MKTLIFKSRQYSTIKLSDGKTYKIPKEYLVEEVERLLELQVEYEKLENTEVLENIKSLQIDNLYHNIFNQLEIMFQHYQPEVTIDYLKKYITHNEALEMIGFFEKHRSMILKSTNVDVKKKSKSDIDLRDLRRMVIFMIANGFSLLELRKLYYDELFLFHQELIFTLESMGTIKEGTYDKIKISNTSCGDDSKSIANELRKQFAGFINKK